MYSIKKKVFFKRVSHIKKQNLSFLIFSGDIASLYISVGHCIVLLLCIPILFILYVHLYKHMFNQWLTREDYPFLWKFKTTISTNVRFRHLPAMIKILWNNWQLIDFSLYFTFMLYTNCSFMFPMIIFT